MLIDITRTIGKDTLVYPGDDGPLLKRTDTFANGNGFLATHLSLSAHCGTHLDAPAHFIPGGQCIAELPIERFVLEAVVVDTLDAPQVSVEHLAGLPLPSCGAVLIRTANSSSAFTSGSKRFGESHNCLFT